MEGIGSGLSFRWGEYAIEGFDLLSELLCLRWLRE